MFRIPSLRSRINELESDNECLRRIQYELLTTNSILTGNLSDREAAVKQFLTEVIDRETEVFDLKAEVERYRKEAELNDDRVLQTQVECDTLLERNEALRAENASLLDDNASLIEDNARLLNALREAKEKLAQQAYTVGDPNA